MSNFSKKELLRFIKIHYQWIIATLIAVIAILVTILVVPWGINLADKAEQQEKARTLTKTSTYYFTPAMNKVSTADISDGAKCWGSGSSTRIDAYRCILSNELFDPCFYQSTWNYVDCPGDPTKHNIITVNEIVRNSRTNDENLEQIPWYMTLENGTNCRFYTGTTDSLANGRVDYGCEDGTILSLPLKTENDLISIKCYKTDLERIEMCLIKEVWF